MSSIYEELSKHDLFYGIRTEDIRPMLQCLKGQLKTYPKGTYIAFEEDDVVHLGIILKGSIDMIKEDVWGNRSLMIRMQENQLFGETFACSRNTVSVVTFYAATDVTVLLFPFNKVLHVCNLSCVFHHRLIENMVMVIADKNRHFMEKIGIISKKTLREKILSYLSLQAEINDSLTFELPLGRQEMANYLHADRSALTRELGRLKDEGLIDYDKNTFRILK